MGESYAQAIAKAKARYKEAMNDVAADVVYICRTYDRPRKTVCREIAGDEGYNALDHRARAFEKAAGQTAEQARRARQKEADRVHLSHAKNALKDPEQAAKVIASLPPQALDDVYHEARLMRAGQDRSVPARKAAEARAASTVAPMKRAVATTYAALGIEALREALNDISQAIENDAMTAKQVATADKLVNDIANLLMEAKFASTS